MSGLGHKGNLPIALLGTQVNGDVTIWHMHSSSGRHSWKVELCYAFSQKWHITYSSGELAWNIHMLLSNYKEAGKCEGKKLNVSWTPLTGATKKE